MRPVWVLVAAAGCRQVFGIDPPRLVDAPAPDVAPIDAAIDAMPDAFVPRIEAQYNIGGPDFVGTDYPGMWTGDPTAATCGSIAVYTTTTPINGTVDGVLFQSEAHAATITCMVALPPGNYRVTLLFADVFYNCASNGAGNPTFDVIIEGTTVATSQDLEALGDGCAAGGAGHPFTESFDTAVSDGTLDVVLEAKNSFNAVLSAFELVELPPS